MIVEALAPAKVNLTLHVTGRRPDGYHLLDMLVGFATVADRLTFKPSDRLELIITGPEAASLAASNDNLVIRAARLVAGDFGAKITLEKNLPVASGIGGGSSDAAAALRGMALLMREVAGLNVEARLASLQDEILALGADVPMCMDASPCRARGVGEALSPVQMPAIPCLLVNPRVPVSTPDVFRARVGNFSDPMPSTLPAFETVADVVTYATAHQNDLEAPAQQVAPIVDTVLTDLRELEGCALARMSGSGATCFALFHTPDEAVAAEATLRRSRPDWWIARGEIGDQSGRALARIIK